VQLINFTPGTGTNADYTYPEMGVAYRSSDALQKRLYYFEHEQSLNGAIILIHIGTDARRTDKLYDKLPEMLDYFQSKGYSFVRIDQLLSK
jgi:peptidoglycan/xylan/chitin deacetylase (PgdA/CDA1 family)